MRQSPRGDRLFPSCIEAFKALKTLACTGYLGVGQAVRVTLYPLKHPRGIELHDL